MTIQEKILAERGNFKAVKKMSKKSLEYKSNSELSDPSDLESNDSELKVNEENSVSNSSDDKNDT